MLEKTGVFGCYKGLYEVLRYLVRGYDDPFFLPKPADNLPIIAIDFRNNGGAIFFEGSNVGEVAGPQVPEACGCTQEQDQNNEKHKKGEFQKKLHLNILQSGCSRI